MTELRKKLILIDGHGLAYRQFHGLPVESFTTISGEPTNATWGFARTLLDILQAPKPPDYLAVTFDQGLSGREAVYPGYKANREEMANALSVQLNRIRELVQAFNIPILEKEGYEADDVLGAAAKQAVNLGVDVKIVTGDRDLLQLVNEHVIVELPAPPAQSRRGGTAQTYDIAHVIERFGVRPDQFVDYKAFVGDTSDNIPGVRGIGEKTTVELIKMYGSVENVYAHLDEIKGSQHNKLEQGRENAFLSRELSEIMTDIPLELDLDRCVAHDYDPTVVAALFRVLEFRSLTNRLNLPQPEASATVRARPSGPSGQQMNLFDMGDVPPSVPQKPVEHLVNTIVVDTAEALAALVQTLATASQIAFDTETTGTEQMRDDLVGISLAVEPGTGYYIPVGHVATAGTEDQTPQQLPLASVIKALVPALTDPHKAKFGHNAIFDLIMLRRYGIDVRPITFDTMIAEFLLNPDSRRKGLKDQAEDRLGVIMTHIEELIGKGKNQITMAQVPIDRVAPYAAADAAITFRLVEVMEFALMDPANGVGLWSLFSDVEIPLIPVLADLDMSGVTLDLPYLAELSHEFAERLDIIQQQIFEVAGQPFNIGSPKQLNDILFGKLGLPTAGLSKSSHGFSVDAGTLETLSEHHEIAALIVNWRGLEKLKSTYVDNLPQMVDAQGRIHTSYNQTGAVTGRVSSDSPNLQNIPIRTEEGRRVRRAFVAAPGYYLLGVDYSQVELRILGSISGDPSLREAFLKDQDVHQATAAAVYGISFDAVTKEQRYAAKRINFGLMYGMGANRLAQEADLSLKEAKLFIERYFQNFPNVKGYFEGSKQAAEAQGYLETLLGRRRYFPGLKAGAASQGAHMQRARAEREAINMPIQGTAADIIKLAMIQLSARLKAERPRARMILQVHDELVLEVPEDELIETAALVRDVMENALELDVPLRADANVGLNWAEMQPVEEFVR